MKKILAVLTATAAVLSLNVTAFAATTLSTRNMTELSGNPIIEDGAQVDIGSSVASNQKIYFAIPDSAARILNNSKESKLTVKKQTNGKLVKSVSLVEKRLANSGNYIAPTNVADDPTTTSNESQFAYSANARKSYIEVVLNETSGTDEYKVEILATFTTKKANNGFKYAGDNSDFVPAMASGDKLPLKIAFYVANPNESGDSASVSVGSSGATIKPVKNEENEVVFEGDDTYATLTFKASSNPDKFYAKLSTKWPSAIASKFADTDAVIRVFAPATVGSTSRANLALNNPFDLDDVDPSDCYIYTANSKGTLTDITKQVTYDDDDDTFNVKTRSLTTYIISDAKVSTK